MLPPDATSKSSADQSQDAVAMRPHEDIHAAPETALEWPHNPIKVVVSGALFLFLLRKHFITKKIKKNAAM